MSYYFHKANRIFKRLIKPFFLFPFFILLTSFNNVAVDKCNEIIPLVLKSINNVKTLKFTFKNTERINGKLITGIQEIKYTKTPRQYYIRMINPSPNSELLYIEGKNNNSATYKPNGFPYLCVNISPYSSLIRKNNHHTIYNIGFDYFGKLISTYYNNKKFTFEYKGLVKWNNIVCHKITAYNNNYQILKYKVKNSETIQSIAKNFLISEYRIIELNPEIEDFDTKLKTNQIILISNFYCKSIEMYIDTKTYLPIYQNISDNIGIFEQYEYNKLEVNIDFTSKDFSIEN